MKKRDCEFRKCETKLPALRTWLMFLLLMLLSCGSNAPSPSSNNGPLVRLHVGPIDPNTASVKLSLMAPDPAGSQKPFMQTFSAAPFDVLGAVFPFGTRGPVSFQVDLYDASSCLLSTGTAMSTLSSDSVLDLTVNVMSVPFCGNGATLTVEVISIQGGSGLVESMPAGILCNGTGSGCTMTAKKGTSIILKGTYLMGSFNGWSGGGCPSIGDCSLTLNQDTVVQAVFTTCRGWCKESIPSGITANFNGVGGTTPNNVLVVGDSGSVLLWDGATWKKINANVAGTLRAATAKLNSSTVFIAGDGGTILTWNGGTFSTVPNALSTANLRSIAVGNTATPSTFFVGDAGTALVLTSAGALSVGNIGAPAISLNSICQLPAQTSNDLFAGGNISSGHGFATEWDGAGSRTVQMASGPNIAGNINAMLCGTTMYHYAAGDNGAMVRRAVNGMKQETNWSTVNTNVTSTIRAMWSYSDNFMMAVGDGGVILTSDGTTWTKMTSGTTANLRAIWGTSPINVLAVGDNGTVLRYTP